MFSGRSFPFLSGPLNLDFIWSLDEGGGGDPDYLIL